MDWKLAILGLSCVLAVAGVIVFLVVAGRKWGESDAEKVKRRRAEAEAKAVAESARAQAEREINHVMRLQDIIRRADDLGPSELERLLNSYPPENRATHAAKSRRDAH